MSDEAQDPTENEVDDLVSRAKSDEGDDDESSEGKTTTRRRRPRKRRSSKSDGGDGDKAMTREELDVRDLLPNKLPKPAENVKTLGDLYAKYDIGDNPDFKVQVWRTYPKMFPGGIKADGFYDTWEIPLGEEQLQTEYGGGTLRVTIVGPHPTRPSLLKHYDSLQINLAGEPNYQRKPRAMQGKKTPEETKAAEQSQQYGFMMPPQENPKLAEAALKMMQDTAKEEREERRRMEDRAERTQRTAPDMESFYKPIVEAERRRADDVSRAERERYEYERRSWEERLREERDKREGLEHRMQTMETTRPSMAEELVRMKEAGLFKTGDDGTAQRFLDSILEKHRAEMESLSAQHARFIESLRESHQTEIKALRDAHRREIEAEREASRSRESRIEERLQSEREERRRDQDRFRETLAERDQQWKDRMEQQQQSIQQSWESRHQAALGNYEQRVQWLQTEVDRYKAEISDLKMRQQDQGDPITQMQRLAQMREAMREALGPDTASQPSSGGGIGLSGGEDWKSAAVEAVGDRLPQILQAFASGFANPQQAAAAQQYQPGQRVQTPQGEMVVVNTPQGLQLAPVAALEGGGMAGMLAPGGGPGREAPGSSKRPAPRRPRPRVMGEPGTSHREPAVAVTPNLADGLPRRRPPWEGGGAEEERPPAPARGPARTSRPAADPEGEDGEPMELTHREREGINFIAKIVHDAVMRADEPEEFVQQVTEKFPPDVLQQIVGGYSTDQIARAIRQLQPRSAGATPAGQQFIRNALRLLRGALR